MLPLLVAGVVLLGQTELPLSKQALDETPVKVLGGRLTLQPPAGTKAEPRAPRNIMAAGEPEERETRLVWTSGDRKLVIMSHELFRTAGKDFETQVRAELNKGDAKTGAFTLSDPALRAVSVTPTQLDLRYDAVLVLGIYLAQADGTVQYVAFYVTPKTAEDAAGCADLARRVGATLRAGGGALATKAGVRVLRDLGPEKKCHITLPEGYALSTQEGPDFTVLTITQMVPLGERARGLGFYFGFHPGYHHGRSEGKPEVKTVAGKLLGKEIEWHSWVGKEDGEETHYLETITALEGRMLLHLFITCSDDATIEPLRKIAETISVGAP